jgi:hypothetical protein
MVFVLLSHLYSENILSNTSLSWALGPKKYSGVAMTITSAVAIFARTGEASSSMTHSYAGRVWQARQDVHPLALYLRNAA